MLENSERTEREQKLGIVIIQLCPLPFREQMKPMLVMALSMLPDEQLSELEKDMIGIPEEVADGNLDRLMAVGRKFGVGTDVDPSTLMAAMMSPKDGSG